MRPALPVDDIFDNRGNLREICHADRSSTLRFFLGTSPAGHGSAVPASFAGRTDLSQRSSGHANLVLQAHQGGASMRSLLVTLAGLSAILLLVSACAAPPTPTPAPPAVLLVVDQDSEDLELMLTKENGVMADLLQKGGYKVVVATAAGSPIDAGNNVTLKPDLKIADVKPEDYAGFVFPCVGRNMEIMQPADQLAMAPKAVATGKPVAAQVGGVQVL